jgi:hypothetical protein
MAKRDLADDLFALLPGEFVPRRNALAKELRDAGQSAKAREVAGLRRPSMPVSLANQVARQDAEAMGRFIKAVDQLRRAQLGHGDITTAIEHQRRELESLMTRARSLLARVGIAASAVAMGRLSATLLGAAADKDQQAALARGGLRRESPAPGFDLFEGARIRPRADGIGARVMPIASRRRQGDRATTPEARERAAGSLARRRAADDVAARKAAAQQALRRQALSRAAARHRAASAKAERRAAALRAQLSRLEEDVARERAAADRADREAVAGTSDGA